MKKVVLVLLIFFLTPTAAFAWDDCPHGVTVCEYPGDCGRYVDTNDDGICDRSQSEPGSADTNGILREIEEDNQIGSGVSASVLSAPNSANPVYSPANLEEASLVNEDERIDINQQPVTSGQKQVYHLIPIIVALTLLYLLSHILSRKRVISVAAHRKIWNIILLVTFLISMILGLFLIIRINFGLEVPLPFSTLFWHVEIGIAMGAISIFHIVWHWKYFLKMLRTATK